MIHRIRSTWCKVMHDKAMWPINGKYVCASCGFEYRVEWAGPVSTTQSSDKAPPAPPPPKPPDPPPVFVIPARSRPDVPTVTQRLEVSKKERFQPPAGGRGYEVPAAPRPIESVTCSGWQANAAAAPPLTRLPGSLGPALSLANPTPKQTIHGFLGNGRPQLEKSFQYDRLAVVRNSSARFQTAAEPQNPPPPSRSRSLLQAVLVRSGRRLQGWFATGRKPAAKATGVTPFPAPAAPPPQWQPARFSELPRAASVSMVPCVSAYTPPPRVR
jgi:hypothetical protein